MYAHLNRKIRKGEPRTFDGIDENEHNKFDESR